MTHEEFAKLFDAVVKNERATLVNKAIEYSRQGDRLWNFRAGAGLTGLSPEQTLWGYLCKHLASIRDICNGVPASRKMIREKIGDARNYLILLEGLLLDQPQSKKRTLHPGAD